MIRLITLKTDVTTMNSSDKAKLEVILPNTTMEEMDLYCGEMTENFADDWMKCQYWCEGILFSVVGGIGLLGNIISIFVLVTK